MTNQNYPLKWLQRSIRDKLDVLAEELMQKETMDAEEFVKLIGPKEKPAGKRTPIKAKSK